MIQRGQYGGFEQGEEKVRHQPSQYRRPVGQLLLEGEPHQVEKQSHIGIMPK
jgi:hypothetical protein